MTTMSRARADTLLLLVSIIWGVAFVAQKDGSEHVGAFTYVFTRFVLAALLLLPCYLWERKRSEVTLSREDIIAAIQISLCLCAGSTLQQYGVATTTAGNAGFLTAVYIVIVPVVAWLVSGPVPRPVVIAGSFLALVGAWLLAGGSMSGFNRGDFFILLSDLVWAGHITLISHHRNLALRPLTLALAQCAITAALTVVPALTVDTWSTASLYAAAPSILYAGVLSSVFAFTLQIVAQRHTPAAEAALIMSLESVFAALAGSLVLGETMSWTAKAGAFLIFCAVLLVEFGPTLRPKRKS